MRSWSFTLIVEGKDLQSEETFDALFEAGCDDALVGRTNGVQYMDFDREALTLADAVLSAVNAIESVPGVRVVRLDDAGLVSMSETACPDEDLFAALTASVAARHHCRQLDPRQRERVRSLFVA